MTTNYGWPRSRSLFDSLLAVQLVSCKVSTNCGWFWATPKHRRKGPSQQHALMSDS